MAAAGSPLQLEALGPVALPGGGRLAGLRGFFRHNPRVAGFALFLVLIWLLGLLAPVLSPYNPDTTNTSNLYSAPTRAHLMGTDELGRDIL
ncbi:MAG TPA: ABC transporter permease, partial [Dehalococcoidia bacterium]|nr:ABC transporter permease [Dehalococcoidia bacterium]